MLLPLLKERTAHAHARIEAAVPLLRPGFGPEGYARHLQRMFGFYAPLEPLLVEHLAALGLGQERFKLPLLSEDLRALGTQEDVLAQLPRCRETPDVSTLPRAVGCLYVLEGATLGGQLLTRELQRHLPQLSPFRFLNPYGADTGRRWRSFKDAAEAAVPANAHADAAAAALQTFEALEKWLTSAHPPLPHP